LIDFLDVIDRTRTGERISEREYDMRVFKKSQEYAKELHIKPDPETPVPDDDSLADELFEAGLKFALEIGGYCLDTGRVVRFSEEELKEALKHLPLEIAVGEGDDASKFLARKPEDPRPPHITGGIGALVSEDLLEPVTRAFALEPIDSIIPPNFQFLAGRNLLAIPPHDVLSNRRQVALTRQAIRSAGKPGLHICIYPNAITASSLIGLLHPDFIRKTDAARVSPKPEPFKIDYEGLSANIVAQEYGCLVWGNTGSYVGGFAGGLDSSIIVGVAAPLIMLVLLKSDYFLWRAGFPLFDPKLQALPQYQWAYNLALQALQRNTWLKLMLSATAAAEPCTEQQLAEITSRVVGHTASGACAFWAGRPVKPLRPNLVTPLEVQFVAELTKAASKLSRKQANEISRIFKVSEDKLKNPPTGKAFQECYDVKTLEPRKEYLEIYYKMKNRLEDIGLKL
jgi:methylamine--corrinoid protein Co-methyltransferase